MKSFGSTIVFAVIVALVGGYAYFEFQKKDQENAEKVSKDHVFKDEKAEEVTSFTLQSPGNTFALQKTDKQWNVISPIQDRADTEAVESYLRLIFTQNATVATSVKNESDLDWKKYGLAPGAHTIQFSSPKNANGKIEVGSIRTYDNGFYVRRNQGLDLLVVEAGFDSVISKKLSDLRAKNLLLHEGEIQSVRVEWLGRDSRPRIDLLKKEGQWQFADQPKIKILNGFVDNWLNDIKTIKGDDIASEDKSASSLSKAGLDRPALKLTLQSKTGDTPLKELVVLASPAKDSKVQFTGSLNSRIYSNAATRWDFLKKSKLDLRDKSYPFQFDNRQANELLITKKGFPDQHFKKDNNLWKLTSADPKIEVLSDKIDQLVSELNQLQVADFVGSKKFSADNVITIKDASGKISFEVSFGNSYSGPAKQELYLAKTNLVEETIAVNKSSLDLLRNKEITKIIAQEAVIDSKKSDDSEKKSE